VAVVVAFFKAAFVVVVVCWVIKWRERSLEK